MTALGVAKAEALAQAKFDEARKIEEDRLTLLFEELQSDAAERGVEVVTRERLADIRQLSAEDRAAFGMTSDQLSIAQDAQLANTFISRAIALAKGGGAARGQLLDWDARGGRNRALALLGGADSDLYKIYDTLLKEARTGENALLSGTLSQDAIVDRVLKEANLYPGSAENKNPKYDEAYLSIMAQLNLDAASKFETSQQALSQDEIVTTARRMASSKLYLDGQAIPFNEPLATTDPTEIRETDIPAPVLLRLMEVARSPSNPNPSPEQIKSMFLALMRREATVRDETALATPAQSARVFQDRWSFLNDPSAHARLLEHFGSRVPPDAVERLEDAKSFGFGVDVNLSDSGPLEWSIMRKLSTRASPATYSEEEADAIVRAHLALTALSEPEG